MRSAPERVDALRAALAEAAQRVYDAWDQDAEGVDPELGTGGICDGVADAMAEVLGRLDGADAVTEYCQTDTHTYVVLAIDEGVFKVDVPAAAYETGFGYVWRKRPGIKLKPEDVSIEKLSDDRGELENFVS